MQLFIRLFRGEEEDEEDIKKMSIREGEEDRESMFRRCKNTMHVVLHIRTQTEAWVTLWMLSINRFHLKHTSLLYGNLLEPFLCFIFVIPALLMTFCINLYVLSQTLDFGTWEIDNYGDLLGLDF